jgi:hypothetical protein
MKVLTTLLVLVIGAVLLVPVVGLALAVAVPLGTFLLWILPILIIACSDKTTGGEKLAWILAIVFLSWFAWVFYFLLAPIKPRREYLPDAAYRSYRYR